MLLLQWKDSITVAVYRWVSRLDRPQDEHLTCSQRGGGVWGWGENLPLALAHG